MSQDADREMLTLVLMLTACMRAKLQGCGPLPLNRRPGFDATGCGPYNRSYGGMADAALTLARC